ncbi:unnamed protein product, partial [Phaeothamnion confervicola]
LPPRHWRWAATAECLWGAALTAAARPESQDDTTLEELRSAAIGRFAAAAAASARARSPGQAVDALRRLWNCALPAAKTPAGRRQVSGAVSTALAALSGGNGRANILRAQLGLLLCECYADIAAWRDGLAAVTAAAALAPPWLQRPLWRWRVLFCSKLGIDAGAATAKLDPAVRAAQVWSVMAQTVQGTQKQLEARLAGLAALEIGGRFERVTALVDLAEWMSARGLPAADAYVNFEAALDMLCAADEESRARAEAESGGGGGDGGGGSDASSSSSRT